MVDEVIKNILKAKDHQKTFKDKLNTLVNELKQAEDEMAKQYMDHLASGDYVVPLSGVNA